MADFFKNASLDRYALMKQFARKMRHNQTDTESILWDRLKRRGLGVRFRRQYIIDDYIVDFICLEYNLIIEVDGEYHTREEQIRYDADRTNRFIARGFNIIRFTNEEIIADIDNVIEKIKSLLT